MAPIRFTGMASGLDTEKMIKDLMKAQREPVNRLVRKKQTDEWKRDTYREMNTLLDELRKSVEMIRYSSNFKRKVAFSENDGIVAAKVVGTPQYSSFAVEVKQLAKAEMPAGVDFKVQGITGKDQQADVSGTLIVNGKSITIEESDSISKIIEKVNTTSGVGVEAKFVDGKLIFTSTSGATLTGTDNLDPTRDKNFFTVEFLGDGSKLGITSSKDSSTRSAGRDAIVHINGIEHTSKTNTISFDGVDFTLKASNEGSAINISTKTDEESIFNMIKGFVDKYNEVIDKINKKISEPKYRSYKPLLDEEKEALPEKTADKMEAMAKSGILLRDPILKGALDQMRYAISTPLKVDGVNESFNTLSKIGIGGPPSGKYAYQENGKLYIDETKLRESIRNNGDDVLKLFTNFSKSDDAATKFSESGVAERLYSQLTKAMDKVTKEAGSSLSTVDDSVIGRNIKNTNKEIDLWEDRLKLIEDRYWKQFTAMEKAMAKFQSQGNWFAQMFGQQ
ncbi:flagellar filament capping protein FliD [Brevibacillus ruminantium]|uniref:Flagellar hook-associated protein 2 n=1 Tax=Brevibacillus ruminantium TaxID=2950604 RepID=A0ABY4WEK1_9BACL|nr:flagellar filament capping protein FliD [Brevibacillus ruminantium]USG65319.1 flagellar filament capping protein FliD [Brevibacillus ruminantium]